MSKNFLRESLVCLTGIIIGAVATYNILPHHHYQESAEEYHVHADFVVKINDDLIDFAKPELMTTASQERHEHVHLHDDNGKVLHMHEKDISFVEFLSSLDTRVTNDCITVGEGKEYCENETKKLTLYVNGNPWPEDLTSYVPQDLDRVFLYYGDQTESQINDLINNVPTDACLYSGSCPERGIAPPESCGLTCEL